MSKLEHDLPAPPQPARNVAVVDDNRDVREAIGGVLRSRGYQVQLFGTAAALLSSAMLAQFDCIVSDVQMPGMSGLELLEALRLAQQCTPLVLMTALADRSTQQRALAGGAYCLLAKPFPVEQLANCVMAALGRADPP